MNDRTDEPDNDFDMQCGALKETDAITIYNVHIYREMRLYYPGIEAASHEEAARIAADKCSHEADYIADCEGDNLAAMVDVEGDTEYLQTKTIEFQPRGGRP